MNGTYITHTPYYTMDFPLQAQTALDAYFHRGEALPRDAVTQLVPLWRAQSPPSPLTKGGSKGRALLGLGSGAGAARAGVYSQDAAIEGECRAPKERDYLAPFVVRGG